MKGPSFHPYSLRRECSRRIYYCPSIGPISNFAKTGAVAESEGLTGRLVKIESWPRTSRVPSRIYWFVEWETNFPSFSCCCYPSRGKEIGAIFPSDDDDEGKFAIPFNECWSFRRFWAASSSEGSGGLSTSRKVSEEVSGHFPPEEYFSQYAKLSDPGRKRTGYHLHIRATDNWTGQRGLLTDHSWTIRWIGDMESQ